MNLWDYLILAAVVIAVVFALRRMRRTRKNGGCGCGCDGCDRRCADPNDKKSTR